jgi:hypothetical protein
MKSDRFAVPGSWAPEGPTTTNQDPASNKAAAMQGTNQLPRFISRLLRVLTVVPVESCLGQLFKDWIRQSLRILFKISGELDRSYTNDPAP